MTILFLVFNFCFVDKRKVSERDEKLRRVKKETMKEMCMNDTKSSKNKK